LVFLTMTVRCTSYPCLCAVRVSFACTSQRCLVTQMDEPINPPPSRLTRACSPAHWLPVLNFRLSSIESRTNGSFLDLSSSIASMLTPVHQSMYLCHEEGLILKM
jgi:hypothetical protein